MKYALASVRLSVCLSATVWNDNVDEMPTPISEAMIARGYLQSAAFAIW